MFTPCVGEPGDQSETSLLGGNLATSCGLAAVRFKSALLRPGACLWQIEMGDHVAQLVILEPIRIVVASVIESIRAELPFTLDLPDAVERLEGGLDDEMVGKGQGISTIVDRDHDFVNLLSGSNTHQGGFAVWADHASQICQAHTRNPWNPDFAAPHGSQRSEHQGSALVERDPEARHARVSDGQLAGRTLFQEKRDHAAAAPDDVPVSNHAKSAALVAHVTIARYEQLVGAEFRGAIEIDGVGGLIGAQGHHTLHAGVNGCVDDVFGA